MAGSSEFMLRLPSAFFDTASVPLIYSLGTEPRNRRAGLFAALLVTFYEASILPYYCEHCGTKSAKTLQRKGVRSMEKVEVRKSKRKFPFK
jgi:hypothetical protein